MSGRRFGGPAQTFLAQALVYDGDDGLPWPFNTNGRGYGKVWDSPLRKERLVCVVICEATHGPKPTGTECRHSCGNRGCINRRHLSWGTHLDNMNDKKAHGTTGHKLNQQQADEIRRLYKEGNMKQQDIADQFGVTQVLVSMIVLDKIWTGAIK